MSDTPRTDAVRDANIGHPLRMARMISHARELELELTEDHGESKRLALAGYELLEAIRVKLGLPKLIELGEGTGVSHIGYAAYLEACEKLKGETK